jgi:tryptophanyl-tRNA synthetase
MPPPSGPKRFLSGIQPSGELHLGNYFGAIREHVRLQDDGDSYYFIADYHALTSLRKPEEIRKNTLDLAMTYLACGLDPNRSTLFRQSDVPEVTEIMWLLMTVTPMAMLQNATSFKDKTERGIPADTGLFSYPVLMAADILAQSSDVVPVGKDQVQHVEMTRDIAEKYNRLFPTKAPVFKIPEYSLGVAPYVPGTDGAKMSKSYKNAIGIFDEGKKLKDAVMGIKTDSKGVADPKDPDTCTIFKLYQLMATPEEQQSLREQYTAGGMGYGTAKQALHKKIDETFAPMREKYKAFATRPSDAQEILAAGATKARANARAVLERAREACGFLATPVTP